MLDGCWYIEGGLCHNRQKWEEWEKMPKGEWYEEYILANSIAKEYPGYNEKNA